MAVFMLATLKLSRTLKLSLETTLTSSSKTENREDVKPLKFKNVTPLTEKKTPAMLSACSIVRRLARLKLLVYSVLQM